LSDFVQVCPKKQANEGTEEKSALPMKSPKLLRQKRMAPRRIELRTHGFSVRDQRLNYNRLRNKRLAKLALIIGLKPCVPPPHIQKGHPGVSGDLRVKETSEGILIGTLRVA
jgi:hypothetical protein